MKNYQKSVYLVRFNSGKMAKKRFKHLKNEQESHWLSSCKWVRVKQENINDLKGSEIQDSEK